MSPIWERKGVSRLHVFILALLLVSCLIMPVPGVYATLTVTQPSIADTCINEELPNKNYGWHPDIFVNAYSAGRERALVKFELSGISSGASINSARLKLYYCDAFGNPAGRTFNAYRVTKDWVEYQATWNDYSAGHPWTNPGGDYTTEGGSSSTVPATIGQWMVWDVTAIVKAWIEGGKPNYGFIIKLEQEEK
ncbi:MAG: DNRLRE domain-containing protein, partial [Candidatus Bathyarchaeia archaeon]